MNHFFYTAYNSIPDTFYVLLVLIVIDYITGVCLALKEKTTSSKIGAKGIASKVLIVCMVALSYIVDTWILHSSEKFSSITIFLSSFAATATALSSSAAFLALLTPTEEPAFAGFTYTG